MSPLNKVTLFFTFCYTNISQPYISVVRSRVHFRASPSYDPRNRVFFRPDCTRPNNSPVQVSFRSEITVTGRSPPTQPATYSPPATQPTVGHKAKCSSYDRLDVDGNSQVLSLRASRLQDGGSISKATHTAAGGAAHVLAGIGSGTVG